MLDNPTLLQAPTNRSSTPAERLRTTMAACRVQFTWFGTQKTLTRDQRAQPAGFNAFGMRTVYDICLPGVRRPARKAFLNAISALALATVTLGGAWLGIGLLGPLGAFPGLLIGLAAGGRYLAEGGYYRR